MPSQLDCAPSAWGHLEVTSTSFYKSRLQAKSCGELVKGGYTTSGLARGLVEQQQQPPFRQPQQQQPGQPQQQYRFSCCSGSADSTLPELPSGMAASVLSESSAYSSEAGDCFRRSSRPGRIGSRQAKIGPGHCLVLLFRWWSVWMLIAVSIVSSFS